ncbi:peptide transporter family 1 isoform X2 [Drosophila grimshawi]|nr:peptide transporter family 1 isoform X2 [Drosophila grimshawi]XP_032597167.1 peptide transporter family 1 isoform X2 [Drosophila grimshawi]
MRAILGLYLTHKLGYNEERATVLFHIFTMVVYIFPLVGALIADGCLGKYKTILYLSIIYCLGAMLVAIGAIPILGMPVKGVTAVGLLLIALGTGGIKPCVSAFGGDQFKLPAQALDLLQFFSLFYFAINAGSTISTMVTPILRADVHCFGDDDCYSLAFGVPALLMIVSMVIFVAGRSRYTRNPPSGHMIFGVSQCITNAIKGWCENSANEPHEHFLDYAEPVVGKQIVHETKCLTRILLLYMSFPLFWALSDQQGSRWTFQATHMDGRLLSVRIKPDQMQVINPLLILIFIPLFDKTIYPTLARWGIRRPLQKLAIGLLLAAIGFLLSAAVELRLEQVEPSAAPSSPRMAHLRLYNGMPCRYDFSCSDLHSSIEPLDMWSNLAMIVPQRTEYAFKAQPQLQSPSSQCPIIEAQIRLEPGSSVSYFLAKNSLHKFRDGVNSGQRMNRAPLLRTLVNIPDDEGPIMLRTLLDRSTPSAIQLDTTNLSALHELSFGCGQLDINGKRAASFETKNGGLYSLLVQGNASDGYLYNMVEVVPPTSVSVLWQLPQIVVMTAAEIMFSVTGLEFSFTEAPENMKSVLQACWLLSVAIGNMLVVIIAEVKFVRTQSAEFALFAAIMLVNLVIFLCLARNYEYVNLSLFTKDAEIEAGKYERERNLIYEQNIKRIVGPVLAKKEAYRKNTSDTYLDT